MPKNYSDSYYLTAVDVANLIDNYHQAYLEKYPGHDLSRKDDRFWMTEKGEFVFYAGEQALLDLDNEAKIQPLGRGLYDATLTLTARFLELGIPEIPAKNIHIISLINFDRGHWTSVVLSIKDLNKQKYQEIYQLYQQFKEYVRVNQPDFVFGREQNIFVQYATGNRHGALGKVRNDTEILIRAFFESIGKKELLEVKPKEGEKNYIEGDLKLVLESNNPEQTGLYHFDSMPSDFNNKRVEQACSRFIEINQVNYAWPTNLVHQTGATCGEHAILNALRYVFLNLNNVVSSKDLREATNHFCPDFAKLFLFDYEAKTYKDNFNFILAQQLSLEQGQEKEQEKEKQKTLPIVEKTKPDSGQVMAMGILIGVGVTLLSSHILAPALGIFNPLAAVMFTGVVGLVTAGLGYAITNQLDILEEPEVSEEQKILQKLSEASFAKENPRPTTKPQVLPEPSKTFTPTANLPQDTKSNLKSDTTIDSKKDNLEKRKSVKFD